MDNLDRELERVLRDPDVGMVDIESVLADVHRRHRRRTVVVLVAAVAASVVMTGGLAILLSQAPRNAQTPPATSTPTLVPGVIPWSDRTDFKPWEAPAPEPRATAAPCNAADLRLKRLSDEGATGHLGRFFLMRNMGTTRCTLAGYPSLTGLDSTSSQVPISVEHDTFFDLRPSVERPATIDQGEAALLIIETSSSCGDGTATLVFKDVQMMLPDGTRVPLNLDLSSSCPIRIGSWYRDNAPIEEPVRFDQLSAEITDTPTIGSDFLEYVVTLRNQGDESVDLTPCPGYVQSVRTLDPNSLGASETAAFRGQWRLDCDAHPVLAPGDTVRFAMRLDIPAKLELSGEVMLEWQLLGTSSDYVAQTWVTIS